MIKFFRKIRQQLLTENRFSKYLLYAIGEIILVVVGILIALQINNWNENRKLNNEKHEFLLTLQQEVEDNRSHLNNYLPYVKKSTELLIKVLNYSAEKDNTISIDSLRSYTANMILVEELIITTSILEASKASGKYSLIGVELSSQLTLFESHLRTFEYARRELSFLSEGSNELAITFSILKPYHDHVFNYEPLNMHPSFKKSDKELIAYLKSKRIYSEIHKNYLSSFFQYDLLIRIINDIENINSLINDELNK